MNGLVKGPLLVGSLGPGSLKCGPGRGAFNSKLAAAAAAAVDRWDRQTDGRSTVSQTLIHHYAGSAEHGCQLSVGYKQAVESDERTDTTDRITFAANTQVNRSFWRGN